MFMQIAIGAIGVGIVIMVGYLVISQVSNALPNPTGVSYTNPCYGQGLGNTTGCNITTGDYCTSCWSCNATHGIFDNATVSLSNCTDAAYIAGKSAIIVTVGAGLALVAVGIIVMAAFGLIQIFQ